MHKFLLSRYSGIRKLSAQAQIMRCLHCSTGGEPIKLVFLRHGQSTWNRDNIFIGMSDTPLTEDGVKEAEIAGKLLKMHRMDFDVVHTSLLRRCIHTSWVVLQQLGLEWINVRKDWRLNERSYGALVGLDKKLCVQRYGKDRVKRWRRSWDDPPPPMTRDHQHWPGHDPRYTALGIVDELPLTESLKDVTKRTSVFWDQVVVPDLRERKRILIVGHENNLRSIIKRLDGISDEDIIHLELPRGIPLVYHLDPHTLKPIKPLEEVNNNLAATTELAEDDLTAELLSGKFLVSKQELKKIADRDQKQVYDLRHTGNLELTHTASSIINESLLVSKTYPNLDNHDHYEI